MKVSCYGVKYSVRWRYFGIPIKHGKDAGKVKLELTRCRVSKIDTNISSGSNRYLEFVQADISQKLGDPSNRNFARKLSLEKAIKHLSKDMRKVFMQVFLTECRGPWKKKVVCMAPIG
jgi:hypothetical protein